RERRRQHGGGGVWPQPPPVLAAVSGGRQALRERDPPSFGPRQEDLRICFETPEYGQEPHGHASEAPCCIAKYHCALQHGGRQARSQEPSRCILRRCRSSRNRP